MLDNVLLILLQLVKEDEFPPSDAIRDLLPDYAMTDSDFRIGGVPGRLVMTQW